MGLHKSTVTWAALFGASGGLFKTWAKPVDQSPYFGSPEPLRHFR